jgi:hypothetical protein
MNTEGITKQELETLNSILEESSGLEFLIWNTVDRYFKNIGVFEPFSEVLTRAFGAEIGDLVYKLFIDDEIVLAILKDSNLKYRHFFSSILESYFDEMMRVFLFEKNPRSLYQLNYTSSGNEDILRLIRADNATFDIVLAPPSYNFLITALLNSYEDYSDSSEQVKQYVIKDLNKYKELINKILNILTIPGGE